MRNAPHAAGVNTFGRPNVARDKAANVNKLCVPVRWRRAADTAAEAGRVKKRMTGIFGYLWWACQVRRLLTALH